MVAAKAVSLYVRPTQSADLCFSTDGIVEEQPIDILGRSVNGFNLAKYQQQLSPAVEVPVEQIAFTPPGGANQIGEKKAIDFLGIGRIGDGPNEIDTALTRSAIARLRVADVSAELTQALSWYGLKKSAEESSDSLKMRADLIGKPSGDPNSLPSLIKQLSGLLKSRRDGLVDEYKNANVGMVLNPETRSESKAQTTGGQAFETTSQTTSTQYSWDYRMPLTDEKIRYLRGEISLRQDQLTAHRLAKLNLPLNVEYQKTITAVEVRRVQLRYIDRFLLPPFDGVVTAVFKGIGDYVLAGEPVVRLEDDRRIYLVGVVKCRGLIRLGYKVQVTSVLFDEPGAGPIQVQGVVCAVRGHEPIDEQWDVIIRCDNQGPTGALLPMNYSFDFDSTELEIGP